MKVNKLLEEQPFSKNTYLTRKQKKEYIKSGAQFCPFCKCDDITSSEIDSSGTIALNSVKCHGCGREWGEEWKLTDITEYNDFENYVE
jgi:transcription elongation factor Elf1